MLVVNLGFLDGFGFFLIKSVSVPVEIAAFQLFDFVVHFLDGKGAEFTCHWVGDRLAVDDLGVSWLDDLRVACRDFGADAVSILICRAYEVS